jgi:uncharacterized membrane protein YfhO
MIFLQENSQISYFETKMYKLSFKTKKEALQELERVHNPHGYFLLKPVEAKKDRLWLWKCHEVNSEGCSEPGSCSFCASITCCQTQVNGTRVRQYHLGLSNDKHDNCHQMRQMQSTQPRKKVCCDNHTPKSAKLDWSTAENQDKMLTAVEDVKSGRLTQVEAAKRHSIPTSTLNKTLTGKRDTDSKPGRSSALS